MNNKQSDKSYVQIQKKENIILSKNSYNKIGVYEAEQWTITVHR